MSKLKRLKILCSCSKLFWLKKEIEMYKQFLALFPYVVLLFFSIIFTYFNLNNSLWLGGDSIPNQFLLNYILNNYGLILSAWGLEGPSAGLSYLNYLVYGFLFKYLGSLFHIYTDSLWMFTFILIFITGYYKLIKNIYNNKTILVLSSLVIFSSPFFWVLVNRNVLLILVLTSSIPWIILSLKSVLEKKVLSIKNQSIYSFSLLILFSSAGLLNPGYAIPAVLLILFYILVFVDWETNWKRFFGITIIAIFFASPNIIGQVNLLLNSKALNDDYWNNIVLTKMPLDKHIHSNKIERVIRGYNSDSLTDYGFWEGEKYYPWWFARYKDSTTSLLLYVPIFLAIFLSFSVFSREDILRKDKNKIVYCFVFLIFLIFMIKSSAGPGGQYFYDFMMNHGWFKMFRSPHLKFGVEYMVVLMLIISHSLFLLKNRTIEYFSVTLLGLYVMIFGFYPIVTGQYIPPLQKVKAIPQEYFDLQKFLQTENKVKINGENKYNLGVLLPANDSTWDSLNWGNDGFYEGYHILHWMNTGTSFLNRNGLSFNKDNLIGFNAWMLLGKDGVYSTSSIDELKNQGYDIFVYDKSSDRYSRFKLKERHEETIEWLDGQSDRLEKIWEENNLIVYKIKDYEVKNLNKVEIDDESSK
jgi:hypothetical protein